MILTLSDLLTSFEQRLRALETANQPAQPAATQAAPAGLNGHGPTDREMKDAEPATKPCLQLSAASLKLLLAGATLEFDEVVVTMHEGEQAQDVDGLADWAHRAALTLRGPDCHRAVNCPRCNLANEYAAKFAAPQQAAA